MEPTHRCWVRQLVELVFTCIKCALFLSVFFLCFSSHVKHASSLRGGLSVCLMLHLCKTCSCTLQNLVEKILRTKIYNTMYWKEHCFALTAESLVDKAVELHFVGGTYGGQVGAVACSAGMWPFGNHSSF